VRKRPEECPIELGVVGGRTHFLRLFLNSECERKKPLDGRGKEKKEKGGESLIRQLTYSPVHHFVTTHLREEAHKLASGKAAVEGRKVVTFAPLGKSQNFAWDGSRMKTCLHRSLVWTGSKNSISVSPEDSGSVQG